VPFVYTHWSHGGVVTTIQGEQISLFEAVRPYSGHAPYQRKDTSIQAAKDINEKLGEWQKRVLLSLVHPATDEKLEWRLGCERTRTSRPRRRELELAGYVEDSGERLRSDITGKFVTVWRLTELGQSMAARLTRPVTDEAFSPVEAMEGGTGANEVEGFF
jgi:hypothetical protein